MGEAPLCRCWRVSEQTVRDAIAAGGLTTVEQVAAATRAATGCQSCWDDVAALLAGADPRPPSPLERTALTDAQARALVARAFAEGARPLLVLNGLDAELLDVHGARAFFRYRGAHAGEPLPSTLTLKAWLVKIISDACGRRMQQIEMNVLEEHGASTLP